MENNSNLYGIVGDDFGNIKVKGIKLKPEELPYVDGDFRIQRK